MDTRFVPSPSTMMSNQFATSPHSISIYDQDRSDISSSFCGGSNTFFKQTEEASVEEFTGLDDKLEDSHMKCIFTPDLINAFNAPNSNPWNNKMFCNDSDSSNGLTLNEFNMDNDHFLSNILNYDTDDSKMSFPPLDLLTGEIKSSNSSSCHTPVPMMCVEPTTKTATNEESFRDQAGKDLMVTENFMSANFAEEGKYVAGMDYFTKKVPLMKTSFPPREAKPQLIGVVTPVVKPDVSVNQDLKPDVLELKSELYNINSTNEDIKYSKYAGEVSTVAYSFNDIPPQTVPSCVSLKRGYEKVKIEPDSPLSKKQCMDTKSHKLWEDTNTVNESKWENSVRPQRKRNDSGCSGHMSDGIEDDFNDMDGSDDDDDYSDIDPDISNLSPAGCESLIDTGKKQKQYFWQYNVQAKGPKGTRLKLAVDSPKDPHILNDFEDPVFDECNTLLAGIRHGGKARKGDGNEIMPNPKKLFHIGHQLLKLNKKINACQLGSDMPATKRNESRKEKNKLASRACRLKKKAQHEANKIKLHGLEEQHSQLNQVVSQIWPKLRDRVKDLLRTGQLNAGSSTSSLTNALNDAISRNLKTNVAKAATDYVNGVILNVEAGDSKGGLNIYGRKS